MIKMKFGVEFSTQRVNNLKNRRAEKVKQTIGLNINPKARLKSKKKGLVKVALETNLVTSEGRTAFLKELLLDRLNKGEKEIKWILDQLRKETEYTGKDTVVRSPYEQWLYVSNQLKSDGTLSEEVPDNLDLYEAEEEEKEVIEDEA